MATAAIEASWHSMGEVGVYVGEALVWVWQDGGYRSPDECEQAALRAFAERLREVLTPPTTRQET